MNFLNLFRPRFKALAVFQPGCHICGRPSATIQIVSRDIGIYVVYKGLCSESGYNGTPATSGQVHAIASAFVPPYERTKIKEAGFYDDAGFCELCECFYCSIHWNISTTGAGKCPKGHFKSLDPHWSPE